VLIGIEAGGTKFVCGAGTGPADVVVETFPTTQPVQTLARAHRFISGHGPPEALGIASFGPVDLDPTSGRYGSITTTPKVGWEGIDLVGSLTEGWGGPVGFDTDVNGAAVGEGRWGAARGLTDYVYVTVGTGVGGGAVVGGEVVHGRMHPEMGHLLVPRAPGDHYSGSCPFHGGCVEGMASGPAIAARWGTPATDLGVNTQEAVRIVAHYLGAMLVDLTLVLSPQRIVLGGGVAKLTGLLDAVRRQLRDQLRGYVDVGDPAEYLVAPALGDRSGVLGAIALAERAR